MGGGETPWTSLACAIGATVVTLGTQGGCVSPSDGSPFELDPIGGRSATGGTDAAGGTDVDGGIGTTTTFSATGGGGNDTDEQLPLVETPCLDAMPEDDVPIRQVSAASNGGAGGAGGATAVQIADEPSQGIVIFDKSGSMGSAWMTETSSDDPADTRTLNKWEAASEALVGAVEPVQHRVTLGSILFPLPTECVVLPMSDPQQIDFLPGADFLAAWEASQAINGPNGGTPLGSAFVIADQAIEAACLAGDLDERFFVMVLTDGDPNCGTDMELVEQIARKWRNRGIGTYVFGLPGSEDGHETLDRLSRAGGTSTILVPGSPEALETDMAEIM